MTLEGRGILVMAHPDDEVIFGWPLFQDPSVKMDVLICSSDLNNPERKWCSHRKESLFRLCNKYNRNVKCFDYNSEFYKDARSGKVREVEKDIVSFMDDGKHDWVFTHNPMGEYGHSDHKLVFDIVLKNVKNTRIVYSDICLDLNKSWMTYSSFCSEIFRKVYYGSIIGEYCIDEGFYMDASNMYRSDGVWTWDDKYKISDCKLYELK